MAITALTDVETLEVSLVPAGASSSEDTQFDTIVKSADLSEETGQALKGAMKILNAYSDTLPADAAIRILAKGLGVEKMEEEDEAEAKKAEEDEEDDAEKAEHEEEDVAEEESSLAEDMQATELEGEEAEEEDVAEAVEEEEEEEEELTEKTIQKSLKKLPASVRGQVSALWKSNREEIKKRQKLEKALEVERDERLRKEYVVKAEKDFPHIPGKSSEELGIMLKTLSSLAPQIAKDLETVFKSVSTTIEKADLFKEFGTNSETGGGANAYAKLDTMAKEMVQKSGGSYALAFSEVMKKHPELYSQYLEEQGK